MSGSFIWTYLWKSFYICSQGLLGGVLEGLRGSVVQSELKHFLEELWIKYTAFRFQLLYIIRKILTREFFCKLCYDFPSLLKKYDSYQTTY